MSDPLYRKELLRLAADAHGAGEPTGKGAIGSAHNPACGDKVTVALSMTGNHIDRITHATRACVLTQASASILGHALKGQTESDLRQLREAVSAMLKANGPAPNSPFADYAAFDGVLEYPSRHTCVLLPIDAALAALTAKDG